VRLDYIKLEKRKDQGASSLDIFLLLEIQIEAEDDKNLPRKKQNTLLVNEIYLTLVDLLGRFLPDYNIRPVISEQEYFGYYKPFDVKYVARIKRRQALLKVKDLKDITIVNKASLRQVKSMTKGIGPLMLGNVGDEDYFYYIFPFISNNSTFEEAVSVLFSANQNLIYEVSLFPRAFGSKAIHYILSRIPWELGEGKKNMVHDQNFYKSLERSERYFRRLARQEKPSLDMTISVKSDRPLSKSLLTKMGQCITKQPDQNNQLAGGFDIFMIPSSYVNSHKDEILDGNVFCSDETESIFYRVSELRDAFWPEEASLAFRLPLLSLEFLERARKNGWKMTASS